MPHPARPSRSLLPALCLVAAVFLWGTSFVATKFALTGFAPMAVVFIRMAVGSAILLPFVARIPKPDYRPGDWKYLALLSLLMPCLYYLAEGYALNLTTSAQAGVVSAIVPLLVAVGARLFLAEDVSLRTVAGLLLSLAGVAALSLGGKSAASAPNPALGNTLEVLAMISSAGYMLVLKHLSSRYDPWLLTGLMSAVGTLFFLPGALLSHPATWLAAPLSAWLGAAYLGCFVTLGAFGLYNVAVTKMPASRAAMSVNLVPFVAVAAGWLVLGESLSLLQITGGVVIGAGVFLGESKPKTELAPAEEAVAEAG